MVAPPQLVWKQKGTRGESRTSKSTEESTVKSISTSKEDWELNKAPGSVFHRLGTSESGEGSGGSKCGSLPRAQEKDLRLSLSGGSQGEKLDGKSSKGSKSPPTVFERLGSVGFSTPRREKGCAEPAASKRRRQSNSGEERHPKKAKRGSKEKDKVPSSVFLRLGGVDMGPGSAGIGSDTHSAQVAAFTSTHSARGAALFPDHSVRMIALASGSNWKKG